VAERTVAGLRSISPEQLTAALEDLAASLRAGDAGEADVPRYVSRTKRD
jgi:hypothetical protein